MMMKLSAAVAVSPAVLCLCLSNSAALAQSPTAASPAAGQAPVIIATKEAPPFALRDANGEWRGISITLWERIAAELGIDYRFEEVGLDDMVAGVADGRFAASVAATTITPLREEQVDFSHPFYSTGFGVAVPSAERSWWTFARAIVSLEFLAVILILAGLLAFVGLLFWLAEHRKNPKEFRPRFLPGLGDGLWFSAVTMTTVGYGDKAPRTLLGRIVALIWMFAALMLISTFTGLIASNLTATRLSSDVEHVSDLRQLSLGSITGSSSDEWLSENGLSFVTAGTVREGMQLVEDGQIDAFVYDRPLLAYLQIREFQDTLRLAPATFGRQDYGIALPQGSDWREAVNSALLNYLDSEEWDSVLLRQLGGDR